MIRLREVLSSNTEVTVFHRGDSIVWTNRYLIAVDDPQFRALDTSFPKSGEAYKLRLEEGHIVEKLAASIPIRELEAVLAETRDTLGEATFRGYTKLAGGRNTYMVQFDEPWGFENIPGAFYNPLHVQYLRSLGDTLHYDKRRGRLYLFDEQRIRGVTTPLTFRESDLQKFESK